MKRIFGVGALTAIAAACVGSSPEFDGDGGTSTSDASTTDSSSQTDSNVVEDSGGQDSGLDSAVDTGADTGVACPAVKTVSSADLDANPGWKPAKAPSTACTTNELAQFEKNLNDVNIKTISGYGAGLSTNCADCIITNNGAANWGPLVATPGSGAKQGFFNFGACYGSIEGDTCGRAIQYTQYCLEIACNECAPASPAKDKCVDDATEPGAICSEYDANIFKACPNVMKTTITCNSITDAVKKLCGA